MLLEIPVYPIAYLPLVPFLHINPCQFSICLQLFTDNLFLCETLYLYQFFQLFQLLFFLSNFWWKYFWVFKHQIVKYTFYQLYYIMTGLESCLSFTHLGVYGAISEAVMDELNFFLQRNVIKLIDILVFIFFEQTRSTGTCFHGSSKGLEIVDDTFEIAGAFRKLAFSIVATRFVIEDGYDKISIDTFSAACSILKCALSFSQIN